MKNIEKQKNIIKKLHEILPYPPSQATLHLGKTIWPPSDFEDETGDYDKLQVELIVLMSGLPKSERLELFRYKRKLIYESLNRGEKIKMWLTGKPALNHRELCRLIDWSPASFNQWMKGTRGIPDEKANLLRDVLAEYGFEEQN